jgi:hypothetical protein
MWSEVKKDEARGYIDIVAVRVWISRMNVGLVRTLYKALHNIQGAEKAILWSFPWETELQI